MSDVALVVSLLGSAKPAAVLSKDASGGAARGPVSAPAWPFVRTLVDAQQSDDLVAFGTFLHRNVGVILIEFDDPNGRKNKSTTPVGKSYKSYKSRSIGKLMGLRLTAAVFNLIP